MITGVYRITNNITGDFYIGSSGNVKHRWANHRSPSTWAQHPNLRMYQDMTQFGLNNFTFEILEETDNLKVREQYWIDLLNPSYNSMNSKGIDIERHKETCRKGLRKYRQTEKGKENNRMPHPTLEAKKYLKQDN